MYDQLPKYALLAVVWIIYCVIHSLMISTPAAHFVQKRYPDGNPYYRLTFNLFSIMTIIPVIWYSFSLTTSTIFHWDGNLRFLQAVLIISAIILVIAGAARYDFKQFLGLSQIRRGDACHSISTNCELSMSGVLGLVRHPWYTAAMILLWARDLDPAAITTNIVLTIYIIIGTLLEEKKLITEFGQAYRDYQKKVSMFVPIQWLKLRLLKKWAQTR